jgi:hypothetical protein
MAPDFTKQLLKGDIELLNDAGTADPVLASLAEGHAARVKTLIEAIQCPAYARAFALTVANVLLETAKGIDAASYQEPELVHVGA